MPAFLLPPRASNDLLSLPWFFSPNTRSGPGSEGGPKKAVKRKGDCGVAGNGNGGKKKKKKHRKAGAASAASAHGDRDKEKAPRPQTDLGRKSWGQAGSGEPFQFRDKFRYVRWMSSILFA